MEEAVAAGSEEILIITGRGKGIMEKQQNSMATPALLRRFWPYMARYKGTVSYTHLGAPDTRRRIPSVQP